MSDLSGSWLGQYRLDAIIGRGSTAVVYRAYQQSLGRQVAVKVLQQFVDPALTSRFQREAQAIARLAHPNILPIYDYGEQDGRPYFVTQLIPGGATLDTLLTGRPMEAGPALHLAGYLLDALGYAHGQGVIHRDIKPANILLPAPARPLLADFGIAKLATETTQLTPPGTLIGTAAYIAPERALNRPADARSDLYSLGVVLYELLTGRLPFEGATPAVVLRSHVYDPPPRPRALNPALHPAVESALLRALEKRPDQRYQSAQEMAAALAAARQAAQSAAPLATPAPPPPDPYRTVELPDIDATAPLPAPPPRARRRLWAGLLLALAVGLLLGLAGLLLPGPSQADRPDGVVVTAAPTVPAAPSEPTAAPTVPAAPSAPTTVPDAPTPAPAVPPSTPVVPTAPPTRPPAPPAPTPVSVPAGQGATVIIDDEAWSGGFGGAGAPQRYGGRSAVWIYGQGTGYDTMRAAFIVRGQPAGVATLSVEGMDAEGRTRAEIAISVNGTPIFTGPNPLPDDDLPLESGTWATASWQFDAALLQPGRNEISISNLSPGQFSLPPFFMLDYAALTLSSP